MYYSLTFGGSKNTWTNWKLIAKAPPMIAQPEPKKNMVEIPGRTSGPIDLSSAVFGHLTYPRITGSWEFVCKETSRTTRFDTYEAVRKWLHGRTTTVATEDDPDHYFKGLFTVGEPKSKENTVEITIKYDLEPVRYNKDGTEDTNWRNR